MKASSSDAYHIKEPLNHQLCVKYGKRSQEALISCGLNHPAGPFNRNVSPRHEHYVCKQIVTAIFTAGAMNVILVTITFHQIRITFAHCPRKLLHSVMEIFYIYRASAA